MPCGHTLHKNCIEKSYIKNTNKINFVCPECSKSPKKTLIECASCNKSFIAKGNEMIICKNILFENNEHLNHLILTYIKIYNIDNEKYAFINLETKYP